MARRDLRPAAADHLAALAARFHPRRVPWWDWDTRTWRWIGPGGREEVLGHDWPSAHAELERLGRRVKCPHGTALASPCDTCRAAILSQTAASSAA